MCHSVFKFIFLYSLCRSVPFDARVDEVLRWLDLPAGDRPDFISLYFNEPDSAGHDHGPFAKEVIHSNIYQ